jgi:hypothetical protein
MVSLFRRDARGRVSDYVSGDTDTGPQDHPRVQQALFNGSMKVNFVQELRAVQKTFLKAQNEVDMLFSAQFRRNRGLGTEAARAFLLKNVRVPTGSHLDFMADFVVYPKGKVPRSKGSMRPGHACASWAASPRRTSPLPSTSASVRS